MAQSGFLIAVLAAWYGKDTPEGEIFFQKRLKMSTLMKARRERYVREVILWETMEKDSSLRKVRQEF